MISKWGGVGGGGGRSGGGGGGGGGSRGTKMDSFTAVTPPCPSGCEATSSGGMMAGFLHKDEPTSLADTTCEEPGAFFFPRAGTYLSTRTHINTTQDSPHNDSPVFCPNSPTVVWLPSQPRRPRQQAASSSSPPFYIRQNLFEAPVWISILVQNSTAHLRGIIFNCLDM